MVFVGIPDADDSGRRLLVSSCTLSVFNSVSGCDCKMRRVLQDAGRCSKSQWDAFRTEASIQFIYRRMPNAKISRLRIPTFWLGTRLLLSLNSWPASQLTALLFAADLG